MTTTTIDLTKLGNVLVGTRANDAMKLEILDSKVSTSHAPKPTSKIVPAVPKGGQ